MPRRLLNNMPSRNYRYFLDLTRPKGSSLGQFAVVPDIGPPAEWIRLAALRRWLDPVRVAEAEVTIAPAWHHESGAPYVGGLRAAARAEGLPTVVDDIPLNYFRSLAVRVSQGLVEQKKLASGDLFEFTVTAFPDGEADTKASAANEDFEELPVPLPVKSSSLREFQANSDPFADPGEEDLPVFVPQRILDEVVALTERGGAMEVGSILLGHVHCDREQQAVFLEVTEQIPARHAVSESMSLSFTPETWTEVSAALAVRRRQEQVIGWYHSHPAIHWCNKECPPEAKKRCPLALNFFSGADCTVQRAVFWKSHSVAIVVTHAYDGMKIAMFGWNKGLMAQRGFHIIRTERSPRSYQPAEALAQIGETDHEKTCPS